MNLVGIDIGSTSICGTILDAESKKVLDCVSIPNRAAIPSSVPWEKCQDPQIILDDVVDILRRFESNFTIDGIGVTGQMHGIVYVDTAGRHVSPLYTWQDGRGDLAFEGSTYANWLSQITGYPVFSGFGLVTHFYLTEHRNVPERAHKLCLIADYVVMRLTNLADPVIDMTSAASIGFFHLQRQAFDGEAIAKINMPTDMLPTVVETKTCAGLYMNRIPVYVAIGDNQASFLASVESPTDTVLVNIGTGAQIAFYSHSLLDLNGWEARPFPGGGYLMVGATLSGGKSYAMLEQFFRQVCALFGDGQPEALYEKMESVIENGKPDTSPLIVNPQFLGSRQNPQQRASIENISFDNFTPEHLIVGFLTGVASELFRFFDVIPPAIKDHMRQMVGSGNGIRKNRALQRFIAQTFGLKVTVPTFAEEASVGAALHAGIGLGVYHHWTTRRLER